MTTIASRRMMIVGTASAAAGLAAPAFIRSARAEDLDPTQTMRGGSNNYRPGAPIVERIGGGGFRMAGTVRRASDGAPIRDARIQIWAHTTEAYESDPQSHGATLTASDGTFQMDMPQIVPAFGQPHGHLAYDAEYDGGAFQTVFLRPVMSSANNTSLEAHFVLAPA